jgi:lambda family phage portal protein
MGFWDRLRGRSTGRKQRKYEAAKPTNIAGGFSVGGLRGPVDDIRWDLRGLIAHSRQQAQNNDYLKAYFDILRRNVIGPSGIVLQNKAMMSNGTTPDKLANDKIEIAFADWGKIANCTVDGSLSWKRVQDVAVQTMARDGAVLVREYKGKNYGPHAYQIQLLEIDFLDLDLNTTLNNGGEIKMGIEFDADGRKVAYHLFKRHPGEMRIGVARGDRLRVPADSMFMMFRPERPGQIVGVPWAYSALRRLNMTRGYEEASITAARVGAAQMGFYVPTTDTSEMEPNEITELAASDKGHLIKEMEPGVIETLPVGYDYKSNDAKYPTAEFGPFMRTIIQGAAAGLGVSYSTLANDLKDANFSTLRAGKGEERDEWREIQGLVAEQLHDRVLSSWLPMSMLAGKVVLPLSKLEQFLQPQWRPRGWAYVSPGEEATANQREMAAMIRSPQEIVASRGTDLETVFSDLKAAKDLAKTYGLDFNPMPPGHENGAAPPPDAP